MININMKNVFLKNYYLVNKNILKYSNFQSFKNFCTSDQTKQKITIERDSVNQEDIVLNIPQEYKPFYSFGKLPFFVMAENTSVLGKYTHFLPLHKTNILIFSVFTVISYGTAAFQPSLLFTLYALNKYFLNMSRKSQEVISVYLLPDKTTILVRTFFRAFKFELAETTIGREYKVGKNKYLEIKNLAMKVPLYIDMNNTKFLNSDLFKEMLNGSTSKINFNYEK